ncbi:hypothetical protein CPB83DRAFT_835981 [Crepidotus variabilis]|uniref:Uncharacterized protein n=1 Tax=Crepidotus variabilis TaxID=179855 RepID=A0A9P6EFV1_9AGAR|nr:hypothetical protein CPB83DRAFT_835981 [Crepidotus variabilis]
MGSCLGLCSFFTKFSLPPPPPASLLVVCVVYAKYQHPQHPHIHAPFAKLQFAPREELSPPPPTFKYQLEQRRYGSSSSPPSPSSWYGGVEEDGSQLASWVGYPNFVSQPWSSSIRSKNPPPFIKFDPFADEPLVPAASAPSPGAAARSADAAVLNTGLSTLDAAPIEIQRYTSPSASSRRIIASQQPPAHSFNNNNTAFGPLNGGNGPASSLRYAGPIGSSHSPSSPSASLSSSVSAPVSRASSPIPSMRSMTPTPRASSGPSALGGPNVSKLVAGIMLNRVAVGKPMRRRAAPVTNSRQYIKSGLSSVDIDMIYVGFRGSTAYAHRPNLGVRARHAPFNQSVTSVGCNRPSFPRSDKF